MPVGATTRTPGRCPGVFLFPALPRLPGEVKPCRATVVSDHDGWMDRIHYAGDSVVTGSAIARAVLEYAKALAKANQSETVEIPTLASDGSISRSTLLIGPASQPARGSFTSKLVNGETLAAMTRQRSK